MEEDEDREGSGVAGGSEEAEPEVAVGVDGKVGGLDAVDGIESGR